jgi:DHA2 family multidrug resistance protein
MDFHLLPGGGNHHDPADRLAGAAAVGAAPGGVGVAGLSDASLLCSMAWSLESMIVFRALQGFTGGALIPLAFTLTLIKLPEHHRAKGMAMFAMTATFAPSIGPTLGGWLTENWGWEYIFYINIPPGLLMIAG